VSVRFDLYNGGWAGSTMTFTEGYQVSFNGMVTSVVTGPEVLKHLMDPLNNGIGP